MWPIGFAPKSVGNPSIMCTALATSERVASWFNVLQQMNVSFMSGSMKVVSCRVSYQVSSNSMWL